MKKVLKSQLERGFQFPNGEVVTEVQLPFVATTAQRQQGYATADTFAYLAEEKRETGYIVLRKHPGIKGSKGYRALGG